MKAILFSIGTREILNPSCNCSIVKEERAGRSLVFFQTNAKAIGEKMKAESDQGKLYDMIVN